MQQRQARPQHRNRNKINKNELLYIYIKKKQQQEKERNIREIQFQLGLLQWFSEVAPTFATQNQNLSDFLESQRRLFRRNARWTQLGSQGCLTSGCPAAMATDEIQIHFWYPKASNWNIIHELQTFVAQSLTQICLLVFKVMRIWYFRFFFRFALLYLFFGLDSTKSFWLQHCLLGSIEVLRKPLGRPDKLQSFQAALGPFPPTILEVEATRRRAGKY